MTPTLQDIVSLKENNMYKEVTMVAGAYKQQ